MHAIAARSSLSASSYPARLIANRRYPSRYKSRPSQSLASQPQFRPLHSTPALHEPPTAPNPTDPEWQHNGVTVESSEAVVDGEDNATTLEDKFQRARRETQSYGSALRRAQRNRQPKELPPIVVPEWFLDRNVILHHDHQPRETILSSRGWLIVKHKESGQTYAEIPIAMSRADYDHVKDFVNRLKSHTESGTIPWILNQGSDSGEGSSGSQGARRLNQPRLHPLLHTEIKATIAADLTVHPPESGPSFPSSKSNLTLHCPADGGIKLLDNTVLDIASQLGADVVRLDAQDIAEIGSDYIGEGIEPPLQSLWALGYETHKRDFDEANEDALEEDEEMDEADPDAVTSIRGFPSRRGSPKIGIRAGIIPIGQFHGKLSDLLTNIIPAESGGPPGVRPGERVRSMGDFFTPFGKPQTPSSAQWDDIKLTALLETLIDSNQRKLIKLDGQPEDVPESTKASTDEGQAPQPSGLLLPSKSSKVDSVNVSDVLVETLSEYAVDLRINDEGSKRDENGDKTSQRKTVVLVKDIKEMTATQLGNRVLTKMADIVRKRRNDGEQIMIVGITSSAELVPELSRSAVRSLQSENEESLSRTIFVTFGPQGYRIEHTPVIDEPLEDWWQMQERDRTQQVNVRHIKAMLRNLAPAAQPGGVERLVLPRVPELAFLRARPLSFDEVHRIALTAIGLHRVGSVGEQLRSVHVVLAAMLLHYSDEIKFSWVADERKPRDWQKDVESTLSSSAKGSQPSSSKSQDAQVRLDALRKSCNTHEKRLLGGVINPDSIKTTFSDVHAPPITIEALKTLTSLSLLRPEAFKYGVLATDKIPGLLLYGPPGTGKTLLAKAVAKESGATVLEVSGSEVNDMYVGEGEKNVRAIFTLARKLSPCVVFIDEADAIFGSRSGPGNRSSHREIINQFLREWDGMSDLSVFIMVATNRPFDLDDAVLRRLPRRLLVDLPTEQDREAILGIHLKDEALAPDVRLADLAARTPYYSGSDLKNLCVAAALACVREENDAAAAAKKEGKEDYAFPEKRTLAQRHFERATEEISASISEDMSSLGAIRKFDEQYGDRRGRRKKSGWGFGTGAEEKEREEAARVRQ